jgi:hypothetical protein
VESLMDVAQGAYRVSTASGSSYILDLDADLLCRQADSPTNVEAKLRRDGEFVELVEIRECSVGKPMFLIISLNLPDIPFTTRLTTTVVAIEALDRQP